MALISVIIMLRGWAPGRSRTGFTEMVGPKKGQRGMARMDPPHPSPCSSFCISSLPAVGGVKLECSTLPFPWPGCEPGENCVSKTQWFYKELCDPFRVGLSSQGYKCPCPQKFLEKLVFNWSRGSQSFFYIKKESFCFLLFCFALK